MFCIHVASWDPKFVLCNKWTVPKAKNIQSGVGRGLAFSGGSKYAGRLIESYATAEET